MFIRGSYELETVLMVRTGRSACGSVGRVRVDEAHGGSIPHVNQIR